MKAGICFCVVFRSAHTLMWLDKALLLLHGPCDQQANRALCDAEDGTNLVHVCIFDFYDAMTAEL